ncbi:MAG: glycosyltransferase family 39 protein [Pseudomonadota bacterium]
MFDNPRAGSPFEAIRRSDVLWLIAALLLLVATGIGVREPWPADEPRFAALARDMAMGGEWLFPRIGGDLYQDKPPLYFWMLAAAYEVIGSVRWSFLIPSLLSAAGVLFLVYDMGRRLSGRQAGLLAALTLSCTVQFLTTMRSAQIDATLCLLTTLSLYSLLRHLLWGPAWGWYFLGGFAAGLGVITKGVGFLPILVLLLYWPMRHFKWQGLAPITPGGWRWALAPLAMLLGIFLWFVPMLLTVASKGNPAYTAYRDEILFHQTVTRYAAAWHHHQPWHYFLVQVIPALWLPWSLLLFWLVPRWRDAWRARDARVWLPLGWLLLLLLFFSLTPGKRSIYMNPALPALALAATPFLVVLYQRRSVQRLSVALAGLLIIGAVVFAGALLSGAHFARKAIQDANLGSGWPLYLFLALSLAGVGAALWRKPIAAWLAATAALAITFSYAISPAMNPERSGAAFMHEVQAKLRPGELLALVAYKEQFLLYLERPTVNFGHRRWLEGPLEGYDASAWLDAAADRVLLVPKSSLHPCFEGSASRQAVGDSAGDDWYLVRGPASADCATRGHVDRAISYDPRAAQ